MRQDQELLRYLPVMGFFVGARFPAPTLLTPRQQRNATPNPLIGTQGSEESQGWARAPRCCLRGEGPERAGSLEPEKARSVPGVVKAPGVGVGAWWRGAGGTHSRGRAIAFPALWRFKAFSS